MHEFSWTISSAACIDIRNSLTNTKTRNQVFDRLCQALAIALANLTLNYKLFLLNFKETISVGNIKQVDLTVGRIGVLITLKGAWLGTREPGLAIMWRVRHIIWLSYYSVCKNKRLRCKSSIQWHGVHGQHDITTTSMGRRNFTMLGDGPPRALFLLKALCLNTCWAFCLKRFFKLKAQQGEGSTRGLAGYC